MEEPVHPFHELFDQLGLPSDKAGIEAFIAGHAPLPDDVRVEEAPFWTPAQAGFLRQQCTEDADWAEVVDQLNEALHADP